MATAAGDTCTETTATGEAKDIYPGCRIYIISKDLLDEINKEYPTIDGMLECKNCNKYGNNIGLATLGGFAIDRNTGTLYGITAAHAVNIAEKCIDDILFCKVGDKLMRIGNKFTANILRSTKGEPFGYGPTARKLYTDFMAFPLNRNCDQYIRKYFVNQSGQALPCQLNTQHTTQKLIGCRVQKVGGTSDISIGTIISYDLDLPVKPPHKTYNTGLFVTEGDMGTILLEEERERGKASTSKKFTLPGDSGAFVTSVIDDNSDRVYVYGVHIRGEYEWKKDEEKIIASLAVPLNRMFSIIHHKYNVHLELVSP